MRLTYKPERCQIKLFSFELPRLGKEGDFNECFGLLLQSFGFLRLCTEYSWDKFAKTRQKLDSKIRKIDGSYFMPATVWQIFNMKKCNQWKRTEMMKNLWNHTNWTSFWRFLAIWSDCAEYELRRTQRGSERDGDKWPLNTSRNETYKCGPDCCS